METPPPRTRRATRDDLPALAAVLARAFANDPYFSWLAGTDTERNQRMRDAWLGILRFASAGLRETWTDENRTGAAIWIPPGRQPSSWLDSLRLLPTFARLTGWGRLREASAAVEFLEERRRQHAPEPHYYLSALGVEPERQGEGIGTALLEPVLRAADETVAAAYLETATARNVLLYERAGFAVVEELVLPRTDIHGWLMLRRPGARP
ncbi:MAG TPA: GNAT family N-acetyltransferase [Candidatus Limnocylindria bacterium]|nr:GNAT family N-acetyltransferase [Candidatus Limnocylindria bacterium]